MSFTYDIDDLSSGLARVRLLIRDTVEATPIFQDEELNAFLSVEGDSIKRAAALALETMASNEAYVQKVIHIQDLKTDGAKTADSLLKRAAQLRAQALDDEAREEDGAFDWAEMVTSPAMVNRHLYNEALRAG